MKKLSLILLSFAIVFSVSASVALAQEVDLSFPSCLTPSGSVIASYTDGDHGVVGNGSKSGRDTVYSLSQGALQCLCATDGAGTQTNWLSSSNLTGDQIKIYENQGWIYVPDGSAWGLSEGSYLAQNISYSCGGSTVNTGGGSTHGDGLSDGKSDGRRSSIVQSASGNANSGLATTGNILFVLSILGTGIFMIIIGLYLRKNTN